MSLMNNVQELIKYTRPLTLLFVEDDVMAVESAGFLLEEFFDEIIVATNGEEGLKSFKDNDIDLIITDLNMPRMNGLDMIAKIKEIDSEVPVVILSAHMQSEYFIQSIKLRVQGYLLKPINMESLLEVLETFTVSHKLEKEIAKNRHLKEIQHNYLQSVIDNAYDPIMVIREDYTIELMNKSLKGEFNSSHVADINSPKCYEVSHRRSTPCDGEEHPCPLKEILENKKSVKVIHQHYSKSNEKKYIELAATPLFDEEQNCIGIIESTRDITSHIQSHQELNREKDLLHHKAHHDSLTGLANRVFFNEKLEEALVWAKNTGSKIALFFLDLDKFKDVNDSFGHKYGDYVLQVTGRRIQNAIRNIDFVARIGGDEFSIVMKDISRPEESIILAQKILSSIEEPMEFEGKILSISSSIGISIYPDEEVNAENLLKSADVSMYKAKVSSERIHLNNTQGE